MAQQENDLEQAHAEWAKALQVHEASPADALPQMDLVIEQMLVAAGYPLDRSEDEDLLDPDLVEEFVQAREITQRVRQGQAIGPQTIEQAVSAYRGVYERLRDG